MFPVGLGYTNVVGLGAKTVPGEAFEEIRLYFASVASRGFVFSLFRDSKTRKVQSPHNQFNEPSTFRWSICMQKVKVQSSPNRGCAMVVHAMCSDVWRVSYPPTENQACITLDRMRFWSGLWTLPEISNLSGAEFIGKRKTCQALSSSTRVWRKILMLLFKAPRLFEVLKRTRKKNVKCSWKRSGQSCPKRRNQGNSSAGADMRERSKIKETSRLRSAMRNHQAPDQKSLNFNVGHEERFQLVDWPLSFFLSFFFFFFFFFFL